MTTARFVVTAARRPAPPRPAEPAAAAPAAAAPIAAAPIAAVSPRLWTDAENRRTPRLHSDPPSAEGGGGGGSGGGQDPLRVARSRPRVAAGGLPALRIAGWQVALVLGFAAIGRDDLGAGIGLGLAATLTLAVSASRLRGEWLSTVILRWAAFAARRRQWDGDHVPLPRDAAISSAGVLVWADGVTAVARTSSFGFPRIDAEAGGPRLDLQLVAHLGPRQARPGGWLAITARRDADNATDDQLRVPLDNTVRRLRKAAPTEFALLSGREVRAAINGIAHAGPARETWRYWRSGPIVQIALRGTGLAEPGLIERVLAEGRDAAVTIAVRPGGAGVIRVAAPAAGSAERAVRRVADICTRRGVRLERLDGRHGPAVLASLPIGGEL